VSTVALDTSALAAWVLKEEPRWRAVDAILSASASDPVLPAPGLTELITVVHRRGNTSPSTLIVDALSAVGVRTEMLVEADLVRAAEMRESALSNGGRAQTLSLADALILSVVERLDCPVVTFDRYWQVLAAEGCTTARVVSA